MPDVLVLDYAEPRRRLLAWFLSDAGIAISHASSLEVAVRTLLVDKARLLILNSMADTAEIAAAVRRLRDVSLTPFRIFILHDGQHVAEEPLIEADVCFHDLLDLHHLVDAVRAALNDDLSEAGLY